MSSEGVIVDLSERLRIAEDRSADPYERIARYEEIVELLRECVDAANSYLHPTGTAADLIQARKRWRAAISEMGNL